MQPSHRPKCSISKSVNPVHEILPDITQTLRSVFWENLYATNAIQATLKKHKEWDDWKRAIFSTTVYEVIRWWRLLWYLLEKEPTENTSDLEKILILYLQNKQGKNTDEIRRRLAQANRLRAIRESIPDWLDTLGSQEVGKRWENTLTSLNQPPALVIRANTLKTTRNDLLIYLRKEGVHAEPIDTSPDAILIKEKINVFQLPSFQEGFFEVQDAASQMVSLFLDPKPGMKIVDACAGEGGKTLHLAALMKNKGKIIALDTQEWKLKELRRRAKRAGADTIETRSIDSSKVIKRLNGTADRLLLDVPCSGLGTLRRNPDIKWKFTSTDLERLKILQQDLLDRYCMLLIHDGYMVYSVCSFLPSEGEKQVNVFLKKHAEGFQLIQEKRYGPESDNTDGFYMALIKRSK